MNKRQPGRKTAAKPRTAAPAAARRHGSSKLAAKRTRSSRSEYSAEESSPSEKNPFWKPFAKRHPTTQRPETEPEQNFRSRAPSHSRPTAPPRPAVVTNEPMRLNKYIAHCGICARRQAAEYVKEGLVAVNGQVETNPGYEVQARDKVTFRGKPVRIEEKKVYILMNKPKDIITTASDEKGRKTVLDIIGGKVKERIFPVGRLDRMTTGLLLLTNDGDLAKKLSHPSHKVQKVYHVTLNKPLQLEDLERIRSGIQLDDGLALVDSAHYRGEEGDEIEIGLHIGKNRIVRRIFEFLGYEILKLDRTYYAGLTKKDIGRGHFRHLTDKEIIMLKHFK